MDNRYSGLKVGLEVHIQLDTGRKLFCKCGYTSDEEQSITFVRRLRPTQSELGQVDPAALFEFQKGVEIEYHADRASACLVEMDEEPPHHPDELAIYVAIRTAHFLRMDIVDEIHFMRKIVVDGSNTTGFQRTAIVGLNGSFTVKGKRYGVQTLAIEEEASRLIDRGVKKVKYSLDRLGIPLIEISTAPDISTPQEAVDVASYLGRLLKTSGFKKRGIGSIRQDINISVKGGNVVEIKGVQKLDQLYKVVEYEYNRQLKLIEISRILNERGVTENDIAEAVEVDITDIFEGTSSKVLRNILSRNGRIFGIRLKGFKGILGFDIGGKTFAREILERVRFWTGLKGLFHSDELPKYGITKEEVDRVSERLGLEGLDGFIIVGLEDPSLSSLTFEKIRERCVEALYGVPAETRAAKDDGTTFYMRPRPGMARMYPETDVKPIPVGRERVEEVIKKIPMSDPDIQLKRISEVYGLTLDEALELFNREVIDVFEEIASKYPSLKPRYLLHLLVSLPKALEREGYSTDRLTDDFFLAVADALAGGKVAKEAVEEIMKSVANGMDVGEAIERFRINVDLDRIREEVSKILNERDDLKSLPRDIRVKRIMGIIMSKYRGSVNPRDVIKIIEESVG